MKRKEVAASPNDVLTPAPPSMRKYAWGRGNFGVNACPNAFDPKSKCKLVVCPKCTSKDDEEKEGSAHQDKRSRSSRRATVVTAVESIAKSTVAEKKKGECPNHIAADLQDLPGETNNKYLKHKRQNKAERTNKNIATHCFLCGVEL